MPTKEKCITYRNTAESLAQIQIIRLEGFPSSALQGYPVHNSGHPGRTGLNFLVILPFIEIN